MGCHTWTWKNEKYWVKRHYNSAPFPFLFRVFDYQKNVLRTYEQAEKFVLDTFLHSTNNEPPLQIIETYTSRMAGKILFASNDNSENLTDPSLTLERLKEFYKKYPEGVITFG